MNTEYLLLGLYGKPSLELEEVCKAIGMKIQTAYNKRSSGTFPIPMRGKPLIADVRDVAIFTGHKDWAMLKRYTQLRAKDLRRL